jgi:MoaA/NifB/PqqE/SkfB family radical SAM enzyme
MRHRLIGWILYVKRFAASFYLLNKNALLGRSFVPHPRKRLFVETAGFCNLECKFCSYPKNVRPRTLMADEVFRSSIDQAAALGYLHIALTPITGDVFMDKMFVERLRYIEQSPIETYEFYTNFIGADEITIAALLTMRKLVSMEISVYGHDLDSFKNITRRGNTQYRRLIDNLNALERLWPAKRHGVRIVISMRTYRSFSPGVTDGGELFDAIHRLQQLGAEFGRSSRVDNWGGDVTRGDIADIDMTLTDGRYIYKKGACGLPFDSVQITADGRVNACACRDPSGSLTLGDIHSSPLANILSVENDKWMQIIADHESGRFNSVCASCGFYRSIHDERRTRDPDGADLMTREAYLASFTAACGPGTDVER